MVLASLMDRAAKKPRPPRPQKPSQEDPLVQALLPLRYGGRIPERNLGYSVEYPTDHAPVRGAIVHRLWKLLSQSGCSANGLQVEKACSQWVQVSLPVRSTRLFVSVSCFGGWVFEVYFAGETSPGMTSFSEARHRIHDRIQEQEAT
jgi:hypothetical protein